MNKCRPCVLVILAIFIPISITAQEHESQTVGLLWRLA
jgi:hypothetical protein